METLTWFSLPSDTEFVSEVERQRSRLKFSQTLKHAVYKDSEDAVLLHGIKGEPMTAVVTSTEGTLYFLYLSSGSKIPVHLSANPTNSKRSREDSVPIEERISHPYCLDAATHQKHTCILTAVNNSLCFIDVDSRGARQDTRVRTITQIPPNLCVRVAFSPNVSKFSVFFPSRTMIALQIWSLDFTWKRVPSVLGTTIIKNLHGDLVEALWLAEDLICVASSSGSVRFIKMQVTDGQCSFAKEFRLQLPCTSTSPLRKFRVQVYHAGDNSCDVLWLANALIGNAIESFTIGPCADESQDGVPLTMMRSKSFHDLDVHDVVLATNSATSQMDQLVSIVVLENGTLVCFEASTFQVLYYTTLNPKGISMGKRRAKFQLCVKPQLHFIVCMDETEVYILKLDSQQKSNQT